MEDEIAKARKKKEREDKAIEGKLLSSLQNSFDEAIGAQNEAELGKLFKEIEADFSKEMERAWDDGFDCGFEAAMEQIEKENRRKKKNE